MKALEKSELIDDPYEPYYDHNQRVSNAPEEVRVVSETGGEKGQKLARYSLIPPAGLIALAERYGYGAQKYELRNWERGYDWSLSFDAMMRHAVAFWNGEEFDPDYPDSPHMAAVAFHAFALMHFCADKESYGKFDDRIDQNET